MCANVPNSRAFQIRELKFMFKCVLWFITFRFISVQFISRLFGFMHWTAIYCELFVLRCLHKKFKDHHEIFHKCEKKIILHLQFENTPRVDLVRNVHIFYCITVAFDI